MTITLYSGVELRSDYSIVFDTDTGFWGTNTPFKKYLDDKAFYTEELDDVYFTNDGSISISWPVYRRLAENITYMRILTEQNEIKYFFVDSYEYRNEILILNYTLDIWHTYSNGMKIHSGVMDRARYLPEGTRRALPAAYQTNEAIKFNGSLDTFYIVLEYQIYNLEKSTQNDDEKPVLRYTRTGLLGRDIVVSTEAGDTIEPNKIITEQTQFLFNVEEAVHIVNNLVADQGVKPVANYGRNGDWAAGGYEGDSIGLQKVTRNNLAIYSKDLNSVNQAPENIRYELTQIYTVPRTLLDPLAFGKYVDDEVNASLLILDTLNYKGGTLVNAEFNFEEYKLTAIKTPKSDFEVTLPVDEKLIGVGLPSLFVPLPYTGHEKKIKFQAQLSDFGFNIVMIGENGVSDITSHFTLPMPYLVPSGEDKQLAVMNIKSARRQAFASSVGFALSFASAASAIASGASSLASAAQAGKQHYIATNSETAVSYEPQEAGFGATIHTPVTTTSYSAAGARAASTKAAWRQFQKSNFAQHAAQTGIGITYQMTSLFGAIEALSKPASTGSASDTSPNALINAALGFNTYSIEPYNEEEIDYLISRIGYNTWIKTNDYHHDNDKSFLTDKYEPISFATLQISGKFPNNISSSLENILIQGTLISYNPNIFDII